MSRELPYRTPMESYERQAEALFAALETGDQAVEWRFKWEHPRFRGKTVGDVRAASLDLDDARLVVAREYGFEDWAHLEAFADAVQRDESVDRFEQAVEAVVAGDVATLRELLLQHPELARTLCPPTSRHAPSLRRRERRRGQPAGDAAQCGGGGEGPPRRRRRA